MEILPANSSLGDLKLVEVYEYYDRPVLFACQSITDALYIVVLLEEDLPREKWLLVNVSRERFTQIRSGGIDLHDAFTQAENGWVFVIGVDNETFTVISEDKIKSIDLTEDQLPMQGERLLLATATLPHLNPDKQMRAHQSKRHFLHLHLDLKNSMRSEVPALTIGNILSSLQEAFEAIGQATFKRPTKRGIISSDIRCMARLLLVAFGAGSFEIELASENYVDLFDDSESSELFEEFILLIRLSSKPEELQDQLKHLQLRASSKYLAFLRSLDEGVAETRVTWSSPKSDSSEDATLTSIEVKKAIQAIETAELEEPEEYLFVGRLVGANMVKKTYEIIVQNLEDRTQTTYSGKVTDEALPALDGATIGHMYRATIRKVTTIKQLTGDIEDKFHLVKLEADI